jgi:hypothetical protein
MLKSPLYIPDDNASNMRAISRDHILHQLRRILDYATNKAVRRQTPSTVRPRWARVAVAAASAAASILQEEKLESLVARVEVLEAAIQ